MILKRTYLWIRKGITVFYSSWSQSSCRT